jgi:CTP:molybdopterin cytidylyltransferase MocA
MTDGGFGLSALVPAAGASSRMGTCKILQPVGGRPALEGLTERLREAGVCDILVVTGFHWEKVGALAKSLGCRTVENPAPERGMLSSVRCGIASMGPDVSGIVLLPGDTPLVKPRTIRALAARFREGADLLIPSFGGITGHPPVIGRERFGGILGWNGPMGLNGYFGSLPVPPEIFPVADQAILMDMDTPEDYRALLDYREREDVPTLGECTELLKLAGTPIGAVGHGRQVARVALRLANALPMGNGFRPERLEAAAFLHDVKKGADRHARAGAEWLAQQGYPEVGRLAEKHHDLDPDESDWEARILYLADKLVSGTRVVFPENRMETMRQRFAGDRAALAAAEVRLERAWQILKEVESLCGKSVFSILERS